LWSFLYVAFFIGMSHALEADHVVAVSAIATGQKKWTTVVRTGAVWGLGHCITLISFAGIALGLNLAINDKMAGLLEFFVGIMLIGLGAHILYRLIRDRVHFHFHKHDQQINHIHAHSHAVDGAIPHETLAHTHEHAKLPLRTLLVGMMHGMAGSAALLILTTSAAPSPFTGIIYVLLFGIGSLAGMVVLSAAIAVPIALSARFLTWGNWSLQGFAGCISLGLGLQVALAHI